MPFTRSLLFTFTVAAAAMACGDNPLAPSDLIGGKWKLVSLIETGAAPITIDDPARYTVEFQQDGRVAVMSDCNSCGGPFSLSGSTIDIGPVVCTRIFCGDTSRDADFTRALDQAREASLADNELTLRGDGVRLTFVRE
jgi:heat shock protein HslJ